MREHWPIHEIRVAYAMVYCAAIAWLFLDFSNITQKCCEHAKHSICNEGKTSGSVHGEKYFLYSFVIIQDLLRFPL